MSLQRDWIIITHLHPGDRILLLFLLLRLIHSFDLYGTTIRYLSAVPALRSDINCEEISHTYERDAVL